MSFGGGVYKYPSHANLASYFTHSSPYTVQESYSLPLLHSIQVLELLVIDEMTSHLPTMHDWSDI